MSLELTMKIRNNKGSEHAVLIQKALFKKGYTWGGTRNNNSIEHQGAKAYVAEKSSNGRGFILYSDLEYFDESIVPEYHLVAGKLVKVVDDYELTNTKE